MNYSLKKKSSVNILHIGVSQLTSFLGRSMFPSVSLDARGGGTSSALGSLAAAGGVGVLLAAEDVGAPVPESCETNLGLPLRVSLLCLEEDAL